jgi:hypothetical protein
MRNDMKMGARERKKLRSLEVEKLGRSEVERVKRWAQGTLCFLAPSTCFIL